MALIPTKPGPWELSPERMHGVAREVWRDAYVFPLWNIEQAGFATDLDVPQQSYGLERLAISPAVAASIDRQRGSIGAAALFDGGTTAHGYDTGITRSFGAASGFMVVQLPAIAITGSYYTLCGNGSVFANDTNFAFTLRQGGSGDVATEFTLTHKTSTNLEGFVSTDQLTDTDLHVGAYMGVGFSYDGTQGEVYINGKPLGGAMGFGSSAMPASTRNFYLGSHVGGTTARTFNGSIAAAIIADAYWNDDTHATLGEDWFCWMREPDSAPMFAFSTAAAGGLSIPIAAYHYNHHLGSMAN